MVWEKDQDRLFNFPSALIICYGYVATSSAVPRNPLILVSYDCNRRFVEFVNEIPVIFPLESSPA